MVKKFFIDHNLDIYGMGHKMYWNCIYIYGMGHKMYWTCIYIYEMGHKTYWNCNIDEAKQPVCEPAVNELCSARFEAPKLPITFATLLCSQFTTWTNLPYDAYKLIKGGVLK